MVCLLDATSNRRWPALLPEFNQLRPALMRLPRLPDLLTTANLCCGVASILLASQGQLTIACWLIFLAALFDVFDGLAARALGGGTPLGAQLDSLADMVSFGVAPAYAVWVLSAPVPRTDLLLVGAAVACICIASAWRLAKFNVDTRQSDSFRGLPTPASALWVISIPLMIEYMPFHIWWEPENVIVDKWFVVGSAIGLSALMVSDIPLLAMKFKSFGLKGNEFRYALLIISVVLLIILRPLAIPIVLSLYVLLSIVNNLFNTSNEIQS